MDQKGILEKSQLFSNIKKEIIEELSHFFEEKRYPAKDTIFFEGDTGDASSSSPWAQLKF